MNVDRIPGFITVRTSSSRLPSKCLLPFGEGNVIQHVIRRAKKFGIDPILCTSVDRSDDILEKIATDEKIKCYRGSLKNKLKRWSDCAEYYRIQCFHTVDADDPFFDGDEMVSSFMILKKRQLDMVCPSEVSAAGAGSVGFSLTAEVVNRAVVGLPEEADTEMMWFYIDRLNNIKSHTLPDNPFAPKQVRLTLDYEEDYWLLESVRRIVGNYASREEIDRIFIHNPDLYKINWFRNEEWKAGQQAKRL